MRIQPSAQSSPLLKGVVLALKSCGKPIRKQIADETRGTLNRPWQEAVATRANGSQMDNRVFGKGARVAAGNPARLVAASSRRPLRKGVNGFNPNTMGRGLEYTPQDRTRYSEYTRKGHKVRRRVMTGLPAPQRGGRVVYPAVADVMPRFVSMWVQIVVRNIYEATEGK